MTKAGLLRPVPSGRTGSIQAPGGPPPTGQAPLLLGMLGNVWKQVLLACRWEPGMLLSSQLCTEQSSEQRASQPQCQLRQEESHTPTRCQCLSFTLKRECQEATLTAAVRGETFRVKEA